jgi:hypothetical protein
MITFGFADTLFLRSGATIQGSYAGGDPRHVKMLVGDHVEIYNLDDIARMEFGGPPPAETSAPPPPPAPRYQEQGMRTDRGYAPPPSGPMGLDIPSGTQIVVRMIDPVDSEKDYLGKTYRASIDQPVEVNGQVVIPRGADVIAKLVDDKQSGKFEGRTVLTLDLQQVMIGGRMVDVASSDVTTQSGSRGARTAGTVGGGAALGAVIGALAGGGKGAAIGAASGGALGAGAEVFTKGQKVKIPSETRLTFTLKQPVHA